MKPPPLVYVRASRGDVGQSVLSSLFAVKADGAGLGSSLALSLFGEDF